MTYEVKYGESIVDVVLNSTGSLDQWENVLNLNNFTTWTPVLIAGQILQVPEPYDVPNYQELSFYPSCNNTEITDLELKIGTLALALEAIETFNTYELPTQSELRQDIYIVKEGETITDVVLNATGSIDNWETILNLNGFTTWTPELKTGQEIIIGYINFQTNIYNDLLINPACNRAEITNLQTQLDGLIDLMHSNWILTTGYWNDANIWIDSANWID